MHQRRRFHRSIRVDVEIPGETEIADTVEVLIELDRIHVGLAVVAGVWHTVAIRILGIVEAGAVVAGIRHTIAVAVLGIVLTGTDIAGIAHTIAIWTFEDAPPIAVSIETRKEVGEGYSAVLGFFRQFELYYVIADERDLVRAEFATALGRLGATAKPALAALSKLAKEDDSLLVRAAAADAIKEISAASSN